jgi:hypothetical protein
VQSVVEILIDMSGGDEDRVLKATSVRAHVLQSVQRKAEHEERKPTHQSTLFRSIHSRTGTSFSPAPRTTVW